MRTLQELKDDYAKSCYYNDWDEMCQKQGVTNLNLEEITEIYANERVNEALKEAANNAQMIVHDGHNKTNSYSKHIQMGVNNAQIDKESILKLKIK